MNNGIDKDLAIGSFLEDLGKRSISALSKVLHISREKIKSCHDKFINGVQFKLEFRGRKSITTKYPNIKKDIEMIIEEYKNVDSHFKSNLTYVSIHPKSIIDELVLNNGYPEKFACYNSIVKILKEMGYKYHKIPKSEIINKVPETDMIFEKVNDCLESLDKSNEEIAAISIDDKATKKIGKFSDNGMTWIDIKVLDHDTIFKYAIKPFGILDLKTNDVFITCTPYSSTAEFKVDCIEKYVIKKNKKCRLKKLVIFLDNGPENRS